VAQIAASIREFGWGAPILVDGENNVWRVTVEFLRRAARHGDGPVVPLEHLTRSSAAP